MMATILDRLDGVRRTRRGWSARCPAHPDRSPSLSIAEGASGKLLLYCHARCRYDEIASALGITTTNQASRRREPRLGSKEFWDAVHLEALRIARSQPWYGDE
jgi:hypothetical protein